MLLMRPKSTCISYENYPNNEIYMCKISKWEVVVGVSAYQNIDSVSLRLLVHPT